MRFFRVAAAMMAAVLASVGLGASSALAAGEDVFVVPRVTVQAQANSATAAKSIAQRDGRRKAMEILLRRLTVEDDWAYLPKVGPEIPETVADAESMPDDGLALPDPNGVQPDPFAYRDQPQMTLSDAALEQLESGFEVYNEKSSAQTYRAFITYRFKPPAVRRLLREARIPYSEAQTRTALVLPVLETANGLYLWEENNPWMAAWKVRPYNNELTPMTAPLGDLEDSATLGPRQALALNEASLSAMAERYSVSQVIVAHASLRQQDGEHRLRVRLINGYRESGEVDDAEIMSDIAPDEAANFGTGVVQGPATNSYNRARVGDILAEAFFRRPAGNFPALAEEAIEVVIAKHAKPWKEQTLIDHTEAALLEASAYFRSLGEWAKIRAALISTPLVGSVQVRSLSRQGAEMLVRAYGDPDKLIVAMEAQGLALWTEDGERWMVATPATAQQIRRDDRRNRRRFGDSQPISPVQPAAYEESSEYSPY
ncbi:MAG: DUF2066 domain-containing protein [Pseudomonadota bacterium]